MIETVQLSSNLWLKQVGRSRPRPLLEDSDFWMALVRPVALPSDQRVNVLEVLSTARLFGEAIDQWLEPLAPPLTYEVWAAGLLKTRPEQVQGTLQLMWQPVLHGNELHEWYRCVALNSGTEFEPTFSQLLDLPLAIDSTYSFHNGHGERVFYTQKPFRLFDVLAALLELLFYFDGPNERSVYTDLTRRAIRNYFETERLRVG